MELAGVTGAAAAPAAVPELSFAVQDAQSVRYAAVPTIAFKLRIGADRPVRWLQLDTQIRIAATRRSYGADEAEGLLELFGPPERFGKTLRSLLWTHTTLLVPGFTGDTEVDMPMACTYDFEVTASRYLHALRGGEVPLEFLFSGTVFYTGAAGALQIGRISWNGEADFRLPVAVWRETMDRYFPNAAWLRLDRDTFDRLAAFKARRALLSWEAALDELLAGHES
jgi:hypothetical protein